MDGTDSTLVEERVWKTGLKGRQIRSVYLITYSKADAEIIASRESFAVAVLDSFENADPSSKTNIVQWVCSEEKHKNGDSHYHMAVKLDKNRRWLKVRNYADSKHGVKLNFSSSHSNYYSAWKYTTKEDKEYLQSPGHPDLKNAPQTQEASLSRIGGGKEKGGEKGKRGRKPRLSVYEVSQMAVQKGIKTRLQLLSLANQQKKDGKTDLAEFIANRGYKAVEDAIKIGWEMEEAPGKLERSQKTRMEILQGFLEVECVVHCNKQWLSMAKDILRRNSILEEDFTEAVRILLVKGRGKYRNILLKGPANCGKTFILNPLNLIFNTFTNPATTSFAWVGAEDCEVIFLNDFRWSEKLIPWNDLLLLCEGQTLHLPAPKSHYAQDIVFEKDAPIFCTGKDDFVYVCGGVVDSRETEMMQVRWVSYSFNAQIPSTEQVDVLPCPRCFSEFICGREESAATA